MSMTWVRRIVFGGVAVFLFYEAAGALREAGLTTQALIHGVAGVLFAVLAFSSKAG